MLYQQIVNHCEVLPERKGEINPDHLVALDSLAEHAAGQYKSLQELQFIFVCTHNSRRSHLAQVWAAVAAAYFNVDRVNVFSGGTERTAFNKNAIAALTAQGFLIDGNLNETNPHYVVQYGDSDAESTICYSKLYNELPNPAENFYAVMMCNTANEQCPVINGSLLRVALPFNDPKTFDNSEHQDLAYLQTSEQIGIAMLYLLQMIKANL